MKVKDLVEKLLELNQEAEIGTPNIDMIPKTTYNFYDNIGWKEVSDKILYGDIDEIDLNIRCKEIYHGTEEFSTIEEALDFYKVTEEQYAKWISTYKNN